MPLRRDPVVLPVILSAAVDQDFFNRSTALAKILAVVWRLAFRLGPMALVVFLITSVGVIGSPEAHANLAYVIYACFLAGLLIMLGCLAWTIVQWRLLVRFTCLVEFATLLVLVQLYLDPTCLEDRTVLSLCEWGLNSIVTIGSMVLAVSIPTSDAREA